MLPIFHIMDKDTCSNLGTRIPSPTQPILAPAKGCRSKESSVGTYRGKIFHFKKRMVWKLESEHKRSEPSSRPLKMNSKKWIPRTNIANHKPHKLWWQHCVIRVSSHEANVSKNMPCHQHSCDATSRDMNTYWIAKPNCMNVQTLDNSNTSCVDRLDMWIMWIDVSYGMYKLNNPNDDSNRNRIANAGPNCWVATVKFFITRVKKYTMVLSMPPGLTKENVLYPTSRCTCAKSKYEPYLKHMQKNDQGLTTVRALNE